MLPNLTSVKESKLSKHTIVDETLKYHEVQKARLEDFRKTVDALKLEKEALLAELSNWREFLNSTPVQAAPAEVLRVDAIQTDAVLIPSHDSISMYDATAIPGHITTHTAPPMTPANYSTPAGSIANPMPDARLLDNYTIQTSAVMLTDVSNFNSIPKTSPYHILQAGTRDESHQHALRTAPQNPHVQQPLWTQSSCQELPIDFQRRQVVGQGYGLKFG